MMFQQIRSGIEKDNQEIQVYIGSNSVQGRTWNARHVWYQL